MPNYKNPLNIRLNPKRKDEREIINYIESQGGLKKGLKALFSHYKATKDIVDYIDTKLQNMSFASPPQDLPETKKAIIQEMSDDAKGLLNNLGF